MADLLVDLLGDDQQALIALLTHLFGAYRVIGAGLRNISYSSEKVRKTHCDLDVLGTLLSTITSCHIISVLVSLKFK